MTERRSSITQSGSSGGGGGGAVSSVDGQTGDVVLSGNYDALGAAAAAQAASQPLDSDLTTIAGLTATTNNFIVSVASAWASRTPAQVKTTLSLDNVDNTSDATKNAATATLTNKTLTSPVINSPTGIVKGDVGLGNVDNTSDATKNAASVTLTNKTISGASNTLSNIAESSVTNLTTDLAAKAPIASPTFTGTTTAPEFTASGLTGATAASRYVGATTSGAPVSGTFAVGDYIVDQSGKIQVCTAAGTPGTWVAGGSAAWGGITGTLSSQTDLQTALDAKLTGPITSVDGTIAVSGVDLSVSGNSLLNIIARQYFK